MLAGQISGMRCQYAIDQIHSMLQPDLNDLIDDRLQVPDEVLRVTDEELLLFEAMNQKEKEAFVRQRLAEYRVELAREREMLNGMGSGRPRWMRIGGAQ